jgi:Lar family restriction alleviation protein
MTEVNRPDRDSTDVPRLAIELEPCPFCGGEAELGIVNEVHCTRCLDCGAEGPISGDEAGAADGWNRRTILTPDVEPTPDPRDQEIERLRGELVQMEKAHREDLREAAAEARHRERFPDEPAGTW